MSSALASRFERLVVSHDPPLDSEISLARRLVSEAKKELADVKAQIAALSSQQKHLEQYVAEHERIVFSINRLPPEILSLIFLFTLPPPHDSSLHRYCEPRKISPWLISRVCRRWRDVSLSTPSIWAHPFISQYLRQSRAQLELQLERSGKANLHPQIWGPARSLLTVPAQLAALIRASDRWTSLSLSFDWTLLHGLLAPLKGHVDQLEELDITGVWGGPSALPEGARLDVFQIAPRLHTVSIVGVCEPTVSIVLPWEQLTQYRGISGAREHLSVLIFSPNLTNAHLTFTTAATVADNAPPWKLQLSELRHFYLANSEFLSILSLPVLQAIVLDKMPPNVDALLPLLALARRDKPPLSSLSLLHSALVAPTLISILTEVPTIKALRIHVRRCDASAVNALIEALVRPPGHSVCVAPSLTTLEFAGRGSFDEERFLDMVQSRITRDSDSEDTDSDSQSSDCECDSLQRVILRMTSKASLLPRTLERLYALADQGLTVSVPTFSFFSEDVADPQQ
ncbi:hypothetical protein FB451DRAFT_1279814 [Mycena latifolia]|nr:hypothetical protein FB451DRAFT_1279814 [Mycena latifolia]